MPAFVLDFTSIFSSAFTLDFASTFTFSFEDSRSGITAAQACGINVIGIGENTRQYAPQLVCDLNHESWLKLIQESFNCA